VGRHGLPAGHFYRHQQCQEPGPKRRQMTPPSCGMRPRKTKDDRRWGITGDRQIAPCARGLIAPHRLAGSERNWNSRTCERGPPVPSSPFAAKRSFAFPAKLPVANVANRPTSDTQRKGRNRATENHSNGQLHSKSAHIPSRYQPQFAKQYGQSPQFGSDWGPESIY